MLAPWVPSSVFLISTVFQKSIKYMEPLLLGRWQMLRVLRPRKLRFVARWPLQTRVSRKKWLAMLQSRPSIFLGSAQIPGLGCARWLDSLLFKLVVVPKCKKNKSNGGENSVITAHSHTLIKITKKWQELFAFKMVIYFTFSYLWVQKRISTNQDAVSLFLECRFLKIWLLSKNFWDEVSAPDVLGFFFVICIHLALNGKNICPWIGH